MKQRLLICAAFTASASIGCSLALAEPWKFGVISDTQWTTFDDGKSPASMPASMIQQIDQEFIKKGVKLVVAVGDTIDGNLTLELQVRQLYTQDLYNAGLAYYPVRGNHESGRANSGADFATLWPQIVNGGQNNVPLTGFSIDSIIAGWTNNNYDTKASLQSTLLTTLPPVSNTGSTFTIGTNFSYPSANGTGNQQGSTPGNGLSYSFDYNNVRFIMIDQFTGTNTNNSTIASQQNWITSRLSDPTRPMQALVFAHKNLLGGNHKDNVFGAAVSGLGGSDPGDGYGLTGTNAALTAKLAAYNDFLASLYDNNVHLYTGGHDHHHKHSVIYSPNGSQKWVEQLISQSDSNKFYTPHTPFSGNEVSVEEDLYEVGYYIYTVDGARVTVDYYAVPANVTEEDFSVTPMLTGNWVKMSSFGYGLNGKAFLVPQGNPFTSVSDDTKNAATNAATYGESGYVGTTFTVLSGSNTSTKKTRDGRALTKLVNTGWAPRDANTVSDIASIWGMADLASLSTDVVQVAVSINPTVGVSDPASVVLGLRDPKTGNWINAVDYNIVGGTKQFYSGDYRSAPTTLGSYGVDLANGIAWAVVNGNARDFAVVAKPTAPLPWDFNGDGVVTTADLTLINSAIRRKSTDLKYDLNNDDRVDSSDARWLTQHFTHVGGM